MMKPLNLNDFGKNLLVEECQQVSIKTFVKNAKAKLKEALLRAELQHQNVDIKISTSLVNRNGIRYWFECPLCKRRAGVIYVHPIANNLGCRICFNLKYKKSRFKGMVETMS